MKIFMTGNAGFIGKFLAKKLASKGHKVIGLDIIPASEEQKRLCECITGDILSRDDVIKGTKDADLIISLAAKHHDFGVAREEFFTVNVTGVRILLDCASSLGIKKIIFFSTVAVYGTQRIPTTEEAIPMPDSNYGKSKLAAEKLIEEWVRKDNDRCAIIIRPTVVFGPNNYANMYNLIDRINNRNFIFVGKGNNIKSVAYVENLVDATIFLMDKFSPGIQVFNYSDEPQMTISQIVTTITNYMPHRIPKIKIPLALAVVVGSLIDFLGKITGHNFPITAARMKKFTATTHYCSDKIRKLGFRQKVELSEGFKRMVEWYLNRNLLT